MFVSQLFDGYMLCFNKETNEFYVEYTGYPYPDLPKQQFELLYDIVWKYMPKNYGIDYIVTNYSKVKVYAKTMIQQNSHISISDFVSLISGLEMQGVHPKVVVLYKGSTVLNTPCYLIYFEGAPYMSDSIKASREFKKFFKAYSNSINGYVVVRNNSRLMANLSSYIVEDKILRADKLNALLETIQNYDDTSNLDTLKKVVELSMLCKEGHGFPFEEMFTEESFVHYFPSYIQKISGFSYLPNTVRDEFHEKFVGTNNIAFWGVFGENVISSIFVANVLVNNFDKNSKLYKDNLDLFLSRQTYALKQVNSKYDESTNRLILVKDGISAIVDYIGKDIVCDMLSKIYKIGISEITSRDEIIINLLDYVAPDYAKILGYSIISSLGWTGSNSYRNEVDSTNYVSIINQFFRDYTNVDTKRMIFDKTCIVNMYETLGGSRRITTFKDDIYKFNESDAPIYYYLGKFECTSRRSRKYISLAIKNYIDIFRDRIVLTNLNPSVLLSYTEVLTALAVNKLYNLGVFAYGDLYIGRTSLVNINYSGKDTNKPVIELRFERRV